MMRRMHVRWQGTSWLECNMGEMRTRTCVNRFPQWAMTDCLAHAYFAARWSHRLGGWLSFCQYVVTVGRVGGYAAVLHVDCTRWGLPSVVMPSVRARAACLTGATFEYVGKSHGVAVWRPFKFWYLVTLRLGASVVGCITRAPSV